MGRKIIVEWLRTNGWMQERRQLAREPARAKPVALPPAKGVGRTGRGS